MASTNTYVLGLLGVVLLLFFPAIMVYQTRGLAGTEAVHSGGDGIGASSGGADADMLLGSLGTLGGLDSRSKEELETVEKHILLQFEMAQSVVEQQLVADAWAVPPREQLRMDAQWLAALREDAVAFAPRGVRTAQLISHATRLIERLQKLAGSGIGAEEQALFFFKGGTGSKASEQHRHVASGIDRQPADNNKVFAAVAKTDAKTPGGGAQGGQDPFVHFRGPAATPEATAARGRELVYAILTGGSRRNVLGMVDRLTGAGVQEPQIRVMVDCKHCFNHTRGSGYDLQFHFKVIAELLAAHPGVRVVPVDLERNRRDATGGAGATVPTSVRSVAVADRVARLETYINNDVVGHDVVAARGVSVEACVEVCLANERCNAAAYVRDTLDCWMKELLDVQARSLVPSSGVDLLSVCDSTAHPDACPPPPSAEEGSAPPTAAIPFASETEVIPPEERVGEVYFWLVDHLFGGAASAGTRAGTRVSAEHHEAAVPYAVVLEDDYTLSPDVHHFYTTGSFLLDADPTLFCVTGHAEHAMEAHAQDPGALLRTEFFPVLAWMTSLAAFDRWLRPVMPSDHRFGGSVSAGGRHSGHWDHFIKLHVFRAPGEAGRKSDHAHKGKYAQAVYPEVPRVVHRMEDSAAGVGSVSTSSGMQRVLYSPVKLQAEPYDGDFLQPAAVVDFEAFLAAAIAGADAVTTDPECVGEGFLLQRGSTVVVLLSKIRAEGQAGLAEWAAALEPLQVWFTFNVFKGTFVTRWQGNRLILVAAYSPLFKTAWDAMQEDGGVLLRGAESGASAAAAVVVRAADVHLSSYERCSRAFKRARLPAAPDFMQDVQSSSTSPRRRPQLTLTGAGAQSCSRACAKLDPPSGGFVCDEELLQRLNACSVADVAHLFNLASGQLQHMLDAASKACTNGRGGFNAAINTSPGDGPGFTQGAGASAGKITYQVILHRFLSCDNTAATDVQLLCPCVDRLPEQTKGHAPAV